MQPLVHTWSDGYLLLRSTAIETRGAVSLDGGRQWPRTVGMDVLVIAALFDPALRRDAPLGLLHRWYSVLAEIELVGKEPTATFGQNREFWSLLERAVIYLDDVEAPLPETAVWSVILQQLRRGTRRNVGPTKDGPFGHFDVHTYDELYLAQYNFLRDKRGADMTPAPAGETGFAKPIPRSTNSDVSELAIYWTERLANTRPVMGYEGVLARWKLITAEVFTLAKASKPDEVYAKNNEFWRALGNVALTVAVADEAPSTWDLVTDSMKYGIAHLPQTLERAASAGADLVASAAHAAGRVANEAGRGLFSGFGTPLLLGAGALGWFLISRGRRRTSE